MILVYLINTLGELLLVPVSLSAMTKLSPAKLGGLMMGAWFLYSGMSNYVAGLVAQATGARTVGGVIADIGAAKANYEAVYSHTALAAIAAGVVMFLLSPVLKKLMHRGKLIFTMPNDTIQPHDEFSFSDGTATAQVVLPPISEWTGPSQRHIAAPTDDWAIKAEQSGFRETADLAETLTWLERLAATWRHASLRSIGKSAGGRDIPMLIVSRFGFEPAPVRSSGKAVGHPSGHPCGRDRRQRCNHDAAARS